jgi:hypothetical protein
MKISLLRSLCIVVISLTCIACIPSGPAQCAPTAVEVGLSAVPYNTVNFALMSYWMMYGRFPDHWSDVVSAGLVQRPLSIPGSGAVDPDDGSLDFAGDVAYFGAQPDGSCRFDALISIGDGMPPGVHSLKINPLEKTYAQLYSTSDNQSLQQMLQQDDWLRLMGIASVLGQQLMTYAWARPGEKFTLDEFLHSGYAPVDENSINPVTQQPLKFDGSAMNLRLITPNGAATVMDAEGNPACMP